MRVREKKEYVIFTFHTTAAAMATEKLAEGIRGFAKDLGTLRAQIAKALAA